MNKSKLFIHCILTCKYIKNLLVKYGTEVKNYLEQMERNFGIKEMEVDKNHIHLLISYPPSLSIILVIRKIKQETTFDLWSRHEKHLSTQFWKERTFWTDGYWISSVGDTSVNKIINYIQNQGKHT